MLPVREPNLRVGRGARRPVGRLSALRWVAVAAWLTVFVVRLVRDGLPVDLPQVLAWVISAAAFFSIGRRALWTVAVDFAPLAAVLIAFIYLRGASQSFGMPTWWTPQLRFDRAVFGVEPTAWLQVHLRHRTPLWREVPIALCYLSFFVAPWLTATVLWVRSRASYYQWVSRVLALFFLGFACFALIPSAPPWAAARCSAQQVAGHPNDPPCMDQSPVLTHGGLIGAHPALHHDVSPYVQRIATDSLVKLHLRYAQHLIDLGAGSTDRVAGIPSLHAGATLLLCLFLWRRVSRWWRPVLVGYPLLMGFALVYSGEHYVFDVLVGWVFAVAVHLLVGRLESWSARRRRRRGSRAGPDAGDPPAARAGGPAGAAYDDGRAVGLPVLQDRQR